MALISTSDPTIVIAGQKWPVPLLAPRQNRIVMPALMQLGTNPEENYEILLEIAFVALTRAHPGILREAFEEWPIPCYELRDALPVIAKQTGFLKQRTVIPEARASGLSGTQLPDWDSIIARFVNFLPGTTPDYWEDALTAPRLRAMQEEWRKHPPLAQLVAAFLGYRPKPRGPREGGEEAVEELMRLFPRGQLRLN
jgi:hypothetical protein